MQETSGFAIPPVERREKRVHILARSSFTFTELQILTKERVTNIFRDLISGFWFREVTEFFVEQPFKLKYNNINWQIIINPPNEGQDVNLWNLTEIRVIRVISPHGKYY